MLVSLPRSGSDWFMKGLVLGVPGLRYYREFFNPTCNNVFLEPLQKSFGTQIPYHKNIAISWKFQYPEIEKVYKKTWLKTNWNITKENWAAFKIGFFIKYFDIFVLYRHRKYTFPGYSSVKLTLQWYVSIYESLLYRNSFGLLEKDIKKAMDFCLLNADSEYKKCCAAHIIFSHKIFKECCKFSIPLINYSVILKNKNHSYLLKYLSDKMPEKLVNEHFINYLITSANYDILSEKNKSYMSLGVDRFCQSLIDCIEKYSPNEFTRFLR